MEGECGRNKGVMVCFVEGWRNRVCTGWRGGGTGCVLGGGVEGGMLSGVRE